jgi:hypothetical protein
MGKDPSADPPLSFIMFIVYCGVHIMLVIQRGIATLNYNRKPQKNHRKAEGA